MTSTSGGSSSRTSRPTTLSRWPLARALRAIAATAKRSMSAAVTSVAPACMAAIAHSPEPDARSNTRRPATASGCSCRYRADGQATAPGEGPVGEGRVRVVRLDLDRVPERQDLVREVEPDLLEARHGPESGLSKDERAGRGRRPARQAGCRQSCVRLLDSMRSGRASPVATMSGATRSVAADRDRRTLTLSHRSCPGRHEGDGHGLADRPSRTTWPPCPRTVAPP